MNNFAILLKDSFFNEFNIEVDVFFSRRKLLHIGVEYPLSSYTFSHEMLNFIKLLWEHPVNNVSGYEMVFPQSTNERNMFYYVIFRMKKNI